MEIEFDYQLQHGQAGLMGVEVQVCATFSGNYYPARYGSNDTATPAEYPDLDLDIQIDGQQYVPCESDYQSITDEAWNRWDEECAR